MKQKLLFVLIVMTLSGVVALSQNSVVLVNKTNTPITIDGIVDEAWKTATPIVINWWGEDNEIPNSVDFTASYKLLWDEYFLYFLGTIHDDVLMDQGSCAGLVVPDWEVDDFEIYWSPGNSKLTDASELIQVRMSYANASSEDPTAATKNGYSEDGFTMPDFAEGIMAPTVDGYIIEASLDLTVSAEKIGKDIIGLADTVGFNAVACDNDSEATRKHIGSFIKDFQWNEADTLMRLILSEGSNGIRSKAAEKNISIYPNPAKNEIKILGADMITAVEVINIQGKLMSRSNYPSNNISVADLPAGLYFVRVYSANKKITNLKMLKE